MRHSRSEIVHGLEAQGVRFRTFSIVHDSPHAIADWDWNQRDLPHIPFIHGGFRLAPSVVEEDLVSGVYLQRVLGVRVPVTVTYHHLGGQPGARVSRVYSAAIGPMVVVIGADLAPIPSGTRVSTEYSLGALHAPRFALALAERVIRRNHARLDAEDAPMRERRTQLRAWGYGFAVDAHGAGYARSTDLLRSNVVVPTDGVREAASPEVEVNGDAPVNVGRDDHLGVRVLADRGVRSTRGDACKLRVYPRMCMHEGASLDGCVVRDGSLHCPWHGRRIRPVASFDFDPRSSTTEPEQVQTTELHRLSLRGRTFTVTPRREP